DWNRWAITIADAQIHEAMHAGGGICDVVGEVIGVKAREVRDNLRTEIAALRNEVNAATNKLQERLARLPVVQAWEPDVVHYVGDVVTHDGSVYQACKDTGTEPAIDHPHWILLARAGRDGLTPTFRGEFDGYKKYRALDVVEFDGSSYIAVRDL